MAPNPAYCHPPLLHMPYPDCDRTLTTVLFTPAGMMRTIASQTVTGNAMQQRRAHAAHHTPAAAAHGAAATTAAVKMS
jgi:hypothetical protein